MKKMIPVIIQLNVHNYKAIQFIIPRTTLQTLNVTPRKAVLCVALKISTVAYHLTCKLMKVDSVVNL